MANTTNYNWETPDDTDLVKDGALAIRTLGSAVDTTVFNNAAAAIAKSIVDAKGDIIAATAADTVSRLAVGANNTVLTADSSTATGLKWATPSSTPTFAGCVLTKSVGQTIANGSFVDVTWDTEDLDTNGFHSTVTNTDRITIPTGYAGKYLVISQLSYGNNATGDIRRAVIYKNNTQLSIANVTPNRATPVASYIADMAVGDYFKTAAYQDSGGNVTLEGNNFSQGATIFQVIYLGV